MPRFVILRHDGAPRDHGGAHWDLMLETSGVLRTWALDEEPRAGAVISAQALPDHRLAYLDYEGPLGEGRGVVARRDHGVYEMLASEPDEIVVRLDGADIAGLLRLARDADHAQRWTASFEE